MFLSVFYQTILFCIDSKQKTVLFNLICKKNVFLFLWKNSKNSYKINQSQYHVINSDNMLQKRNTNKKKIPP